MNKTTEIEQVRASYNVRHWSQGYFGINDEGEVYVAPKADAPEQTVSLSSIAEQIQQQGLSLPALVRFPQILHNRVHNLCAAFNEAIANYNYPEKYLLVYPIKVNQQREVVEEIVASQANNEVKQLGLEAGSKAELLAVLAMAQKASSVIVCNGYKDVEYIRLALIGEKLGHKVNIVLEKLSELDMVLAEAEKLNVSPRLGLRVRLASQGKGKWQASGGEKSKFGLSASQVLTVLKKLKDLGKSDTLQLVHFHLGSQMANIRDVRTGVSEAARFYCELRRLGAELVCMDVGGGLAIDYDGTRSQSHNSMNYSLAEYANNIVYTIGDICKQYNQPMPTIISESGRALTAHHAVLISNVIGTESYNPEEVPALAEDAPILLKNMWHSWVQLNKRIDDRALIEIFHDCLSDLAEVHSQFGMGLLNLEQRAWAEQISLRVSYELSKLMDSKNRFHRPIIDELNEKLADKFFVNFSLFQSLPDAWGIDQVFPVLPLTGLTEMPQRRAVLLDITCDSDGTVDQYVDGQGIETTLPVPEWSADSPYLLGFFLVGAYQEILGDMHNLFGDTHSAVINMDENGKVHIDEINEGDTVEDMLRYVHLDPDSFRAAYAELAQSKLPEHERASILEELDLGLTGYTYLEDV
ncbi:biosynthetic arginine decarboxylase [Pseudoalteromonas tunicata]|jgi:arginine decarboxylase|uniref:Biosynthetic arginine decarboxylase n=1 Tax=Pseudoalteromonas tunicata D2 TaxID=87626 RepID=A4C3Z7_9GAMM|nr:biosynthetic arginine decarboxylase [Pseudoalteromonas tunicata]ATC97237.1 arginine decarboxylase [Pseudoalteromonas tunicata]AXT33320.1 biosynthetic arginine decarboxylase [Pseudoalteromonas tunicata]EAR30279.1 arginine decarboxylase, PLP-binding, biosynthetic [Pseudoalteromonas tunicata D2]MDP4984382.1 biosynthetic arginine decarboxylase [Pseudoalteromonas tunicata]MDP5214416.1 biosynthetic arginine decarboxylase [Pseudoalteromonas tunicata]